MDIFRSFYKMFFVQFMAFFFKPCANRGAPSRISSNPFRIKALEEFCPEMNTGRTHDLPRQAAK
jgi:hypothetical protein